MTDLAEKLDKVIQKYDKDAYFDQEEPGIMTAVINLKKKRNESDSFLTNTSRRL